MTVPSFLEKTPKEIVYEDQSFVVRICSSNVPVPVSFRRDCPFLLRTTQLLRWQQLLSVEC